MLFYYRFSIAKDNGTLSLAAPLDFEVMPSYDLILEAKDGGNRITRVELLISVTDYNDNIPTFDPSPTTATLNENQDSGFSVKVKVTSLFSVLVMVDRHKFVRCTVRWELM